MTNALDTPHPASAPESVAPVRPSLGSRLFGWIVAFAAGTIVSMVGSVAHINILKLGSVQIPVGLILGLIACLALMVGIRLIFDDRGSVMAAGIGMVVTVAMFTFAGPGGAVLIGQGLISLIWTLGPVLIATLVVAWPRFTRPVTTIAPSVTSSVTSAEAEAAPNA